MKKFEIAIVGSGPGGLSAAARAAEMGVSHVLLEATAKISNTIQKYQKGKHVMASPQKLPLRSDLKFEADKKETVLKVWEKGLQSTDTNIRYKSEVRKITGQRGDFTLTLKGGDEISAKTVILGIGVAGNPRKLDCEGADFKHVQYQLDDPEEYNNERIAVIGAGDAAIENALGLAKLNKVTIVNRRDEFARAKQGNLDQILRAIEEDQIECLYESKPLKIEENPKPDQSRYLFHFSTATGERSIPIDRVIARIGAAPPRKLLESFGIEFPNDNPASLPNLSKQYESNVDGLYIIGALGGYPLIKQAMNQGYEVVEYIQGNDIEPADTPLLVEQFSSLPWRLGTEEILERLRDAAPIYQEINPLTFREFILDSQVKKLEPGEKLCVQGEFTNTFFVVVEGNAYVKLPGVGEFHFNKGDFFGEQSLISGRKRTATVYAGENCTVVETPRRTMVRLQNSVESVERTLDQAFILRAIQSTFTPNTPHSELSEVVLNSELSRFDAGENIYLQGDFGDDVHLIRLGSVSTIKRSKNREITTSYMPAGRYFGETGALGDGIRTDSARAAVRTETVKISRDSFLTLLEKEPSMQSRIQDHMRARRTLEASMEAQPKSGELMSFLMGQGLGEGSNVLLIDEDLCVSCDNCEVACAESHDGNSRLNREAGASFANIHVPISCRHCENPHCMRDCPPDAIHRTSSGTVHIDQEACIGCGNCVENCPYDVVSLKDYGLQRPGLLSWLFRGDANRYTSKPTMDEDRTKKAVACDACHNLSGGPACVSSCPTGAAQRLDSNDFVELITSRFS